MKRFENEIYISFISLYHWIFYSYIHCFIFKQSNKETFKMSRESYLKILFDEGEATCFSSIETGTIVMRVDPAIETNFVSINPILPGADRQPTKAWHSPHIGRRADCNVTAYRNFLCEFDKGTIEEQAALIESSGLPYATLVYSGGKSLHAIISLETPVQSKQEYARIAKAIYAKLGDAVDKSNCNPSRFTRLPDAIRGSVKQKLFSVRSRISLEQLLAWTGPLPEEDVSTSGKGLRRILNRHTNYFLAFGAPTGEWNAALFKAACDMKRAQYTEQEILYQCSNITGHLDERDRKTIKSAMSNNDRN